MSCWTDKRVVVKGGAGFFGLLVVEKIRQQGCQNIFVHRSGDYDLVDMGVVKRLYENAAPHLVLHLAARVGGIKANQAYQASSFTTTL